MAASSSKPSKTVRVYTWNEKARIAGHYADALGRVLEEVQDDDGRYEAALIVERAKAKASPIHDLFEWDNTKAGHLYRCVQARRYVRFLVVDVKDNGDSVRMPAAVSFGPGRGYQATERVMTNAELRERLVGQALEEAQAWRKRWQHLKELSEVFVAIESAHGVKRRKVA